MKRKNNDDTDHRYHPSTPTLKVLPISDVVHNRVVAPPVPPPPPPPPASSSTHATMSQPTPQQRYQFRHSVQIQPSSSSASQPESAVMLQTISTGDIIFVNVDPEQEEEENNGTATQTNVDSNDDLLIKHYQKMIVPPPNYHNHNKTNKFHWKVAYVLGLVSTFASSTTTATGSEMQEEYRVIITWLIPYSYIQEQDQKRSCSDAFLDQAAHRKIGKAFRKDGMFIRLPAHISASSNAATNSSSSSNLRQLFHLFGPTTISVSQIIYGTVVTLIPSTEYDPKRYKYPKDLSLTATVTTTTSKVATGATTATAQSPGILPKSYEYCFHCPYALPIHRSNSATPRDATKCTALDFAPQPQRFLSSTTMCGNTGIVPPKMVADAWNLFRNCLLLLQSSSSSSMMETTYHHNTNWLLQVFLSSSLSSAGSDSQASISAQIDAFIEAMMKPYPVQHYIPIPQHKFQYFRLDTSGASQSKTPAAARAAPPASKNVTIAPAKRRKLNVAARSASHHDHDDGKHHSKRNKGQKQEQGRTVTFSPTPLQARNDHHRSNVWSYDPKSNQNVQPVYVHKMTNKKKKNSATLPSTLYFYHHITMTRSHPHRATPTTNATWILQVGDIIAVEMAVDPTTIMMPAPIYTVAPKSKTSKSKAMNVPLQKQSPWYPFDQPWAPAQIVALYEERRSDNRTATTSAFPNRGPLHHDSLDERSENVLTSTTTTMMMMQVRWFYRPHDIPDDVVEELTESMRHDLFDENCQKKKRQSLQAEYNQEAINLLQSGRQFIEVDEDVTEIKTSAALGRVVVTNTADPSGIEWNTYQDTSDNVNQLPILCRYLYNLVNYGGRNCLVQIHDEQFWRNDSSLNQHSSLTQSPYLRGLSCPKSYPGRIPLLFQAYLAGTHHSGSDVPSALTLHQNRLMLRKERFGDLDADDDDFTANIWPEELLSSSHSVDVSKLERSSKDRVITIVHDAASRKHRELLMSMQVKVIAKRCDPRATAKKSAADVQHWTLQVGDIVAMAYNGAHKCVRNDVRIHETNGSKKKRWFPFLGPWRVCQVLNIYRNIVVDKSGNCQSSGPTLLEVRWFLRKSELPSRVWEWMPPYHAEYKQDEVYESDVTDNGLPADHVLGPVALYIGEQSLVSNRKSERVPNNVPEAVCRCRYYYYQSMEQFQPLFCSEATPRRWFQQMIERGFKISPMTQACENLRQGIELGLDLRLSNETEFYRSLITMENELGPMAEDRFLNPYGERHKMNREYFLSTSVSPPWSKMSQPDFVCAESDRKSIRWTIKIGDMVAIEVPTSTSNREINRFYPFRVQWKIAQVLAIYREGMSQTADAPKDLAIQLRWFYSRSDHDVYLASTTKATIDAVYSSNDLNETSCYTADLLGPVVLFPGSEEDRSMSSSIKIWESVVPFMPMVAVFYAGHFDSIKKQKVTPPPFHDVVRSGIIISNHYDEEAANCVLRTLQYDVHDDIKIRTDRILVGQQVKDENMNPNIFVDTDDDISSTKGAPSTRRHGRTKAWTAIPPFHTDHANGIEYFSELEVTPPYDNYATECITNDELLKRIWTVKLGDLVIVHHELCAGRASYHTSADERIKVLSSVNKYFPFTVPWAVAEVVHIMRRKDSSNIDLEIRWLYRQNEISSRTIKDKRKSDLETEEICESDHYDEIEHVNLLAPAQLYESPQNINIGNRYNGMPVVEFHCTRFWSVYRKSLKPIGGLKGRIERGRLQSKSVTRDHSLKAALISESSHQDSTPSPFEDKVSFSDAFKNVIHKLSLTDASKDAHINSSALIGRESERKEISSFLRSTINGNGQGSGNRATLFIAGPPGTGKTACVLSVISDFQRELSIGGMPCFDFIPLNCMEMREPFEAYVKLWTHLEGEISRCNAETSASRLEAYFTGKFETHNKRNPLVSVVLLDEIDYLVTKKQSVLYNFFDWPTRSMETQSNRRLIVIGISNTLNLPERLHPRVQSRIGSKRIFFKSYSVNETVAILNSKIQQASPNYSVFDSDAILYASKKTAALSGDIRKAFHICRSAAEMILYHAESSGDEVESPVVRIKDVLKVSRESSNAAQPRSVGLCAPFQVLFLVALAALSKTTGREYGGFDVEEISTKMRSIADAFGDPMYLPPPTLPETLNMIAGLRDNHLVAMMTPRDRSLSFRASLAGSGGPWPLVSMVMDDLAMVMALKETQHYELAQKFLSRSSY